MTPDQVVKHFRGVASAAEALRVTRQAVAKWQKAGEIPALRQVHIWWMTEGELHPTRQAMEELGL